jgi:hypothetical protein
MGSILPAFIVIFIWIFASTIGNVYITDTFNNRIRMVNITTDSVTTIAGDGSTSGSFSGDGVEATSVGLNNPRAVSFDATGTTIIMTRLSAHLLLTALYACNRRHYVHRRRRK